MQKEKKESIQKDKQATKFKAQEQKGIEIGKQT